MHCIRTLRTSGLPAVLTRGADRRRVAESDLLGTTGPYVLGDLQPDRPVLSRPVGQAVDTDGDGWSDEVHFTSLLGLPAAGSYEVEATLQAPDGTVVDAVAETRDLPAGVSALLLAFGAASVGGDVTGAVAELDLFVAHLEDRSPDRIDAEAAERLTSYALAVRDQLLGG
ncbi:hypothetical protein BH23ACT9_BH23ACT9_34360 [soil metagenome]